MNAPELLEHWYKTTDWILDKCDRFPKQTRFTVAGRIANLALEALECITEAVYSKEKKALLLQVNLQLEKMRLLFRLCFDRRYINPAQYEFIAAAINTAGRMCGGWIKSCKE
jgi:hypothetical protein